MAIIFPLRQGTCKNVMNTYTSRLKYTAKNTAGQSLAWLRPNKLATVLSSALWIPRYLTSVLIFKETKAWEMNWDWRSAMKRKQRHLFTDAGFSAWKLWKLSSARRVVIFLCLRIFMVKLLVHLIFLGCFVRGFFQSGLSRFWRCFYPILVKGLTMSVGYAAFC